MEIKNYPYESLRQKAAPVTKAEGQSNQFQLFATDLMAELESRYPLGAGLAANQVGKLERVFAINFELAKGQFMKQIFINPEIIEVATQTEVDWEGCLSFPDQWGQVRRPISTTIKALSLSGKEFTTTARNFYARLLLHELDHLDGILFIDKLESKLVSTQELDQKLKAVG